MSGRSEPPHGTAPGSQALTPDVDPVADGPSRAPGGPIPVVASMPEDEHANPAEVRRFIRKNVIRALVGLALMSGALSLAGKLWEAELLAFAEGIYHSIGVAGLLVVVLVTDTLVSPMPPDVVLVIMANSPLHAQWAVLLPVIGLVSALAGCLGWQLGRSAAGTRRLGPWVMRLRARHEHTLRRYDGWAVVLGALTPLPFSIICITSGALGMRLSKLAPLTLWRIPKFVIFYWVIYLSTHV